MTIKVQLPRGTPVMQDFTFFRWPGHYEHDADTWFEGEVSGDGLKCIADGFGVLGGNYGNGAVWVKLAHLSPAHADIEGIGK